MRLRRLELSAYRCFPGRVAIDGLADGLTIVVGDNEEGKSTLLAALQSVLFDRHNLTGDAADAMLPYSSAVRPEITLDFDIDGVRYRLRKAFCQRPEAELAALGGDRARWAGAAAEERLREMLAFTPPGRGGARSENRGLQALFWVEQGSAYFAPPLNEATRGTLAGALEREVGTVVGGERGRILSARVKARLDRFFTNKGKPKTGGPLATARTQFDAVCAERDGLRSRLDAFESKVGDLARARQTLKDIERDDPVGKAEARTTTAAAAVTIVEGLESGLQTALVQCQAAEAQEKLAEARVAARQQIRSEMEKVQRESATAAGDEAGKREVLAAVDASLAQAKSAHTNVKQAADRVTLGEASARMLAELLEARARLGEAEQRLKKAERTEMALRELSAKVKANPIDAKTLRFLQELATAVREAELRLQGSATLVEFQAEAGRRAAVDGAPVESNALIVAAPTRIILEGFGAIRVVPGGEELISIREKAERARGALGQALSKHGVATVQEAERRAGERQFQAAEAKVHQGVLAAQAPEGFEALRSAAEVLRARVHEMEQAAGDSLAEQASVTIDAARERATALGKRLAECQQAERKASEVALGEEGQRRVAAALLAAASTQHMEATRKAATLAADVNAAEAETGDQILALRHETAAGALADAVAAKEEAQRKLRDSDPEGARAESEQAREAQGRVAKQLDQARRGVDYLAIELRTLGQQDLAALLETAEGEADRAEAAHTHATHEAGALRLLHQTLAEAEREAREAFMTPITRRVAPYLRRLFPDSEIVLDDSTLELTHLRRHGHDEPFDRLSVGTREQVAVLTRIAFADLLREHGKDSPIVLDDALVYSDDGRFAEMQKILMRASASAQIIVLTCHERAYFSLGAPIVRLRECGA